MAERPTSKSGSGLWGLNLAQSSNAGSAEAAASEEEDSGIISVGTVDAGNASANSDVQEVRESVRRNTGEIAAVKTVGIEDAYRFLHPQVQADLAGLSDLKDEPYLFDQQLKQYCETNPLFLSGISTWLYKREVRVKIADSEELDEGWCFEDNLEELGPDNLSFVTIVKVSGDFTKHSKDSVKKVPLRHIIPFNLRKQL